MAVLDATDLQRIAKEIYGCSSTVWHVAPTGNDSTGDGLSWIAPYLTPNKAATVAAAGDVIVVSGNLTANSAINLQAGGSGQGISLIAAKGAPRPVLTTDLSLAGFIRPGHRSIVSGIRILGNSTTDFQYPIGLLQDDSSFAAEDVLIENVEIFADTDGIYNDVTGCDRWVVRGCRFQTKYDCIIGGGENWLVENNILISAGPSVVFPGSSSNGLQLTGSTALVQGNRIQVSGSSVGNKAVNVGTSAAAILRNNSLYSSGTAAYDVSLGTSSTTYEYGGNGGSGAGGALNTTGTGTLTRRQPAETLGSFGLDYVVPETGYNARQVMALILASVSGECDVTNNGSGSFTFSFKAPDDSTERISITASTISKERTAVTLTPPS